MAPIHGKGTAVLVDKYDLSAYLNSVDGTATVDVAEVTTFGDTAKEYIPGQRDAAISLSGFFDGATGAIDDVLAAALAASTPKPITIAPQGSATIGNRAMVTKADETSYGTQATTGDAVAIAAEFQPTAGLWHGVLLADLAARTATANLSSVDNAASSANGYVANLHVTAFTGTSVVIKVQHSSDNSSWSDLATFTSVTAATAEQITGTGTVNRYVRAIISSGTFTSVTAAVSFARK